MKMTSALAKQLQLHQTAAQAAATITATTTTPRAIESSATKAEEEQQQLHNSQSQPQRQCQHRNNINNSSSNSNGSNGNGNAANSQKQSQKAKKEEAVLTTTTTESICKDRLRRERQQRRQNANCSHFNLSNNGLLQQKTGVTQSSSATTKMLLHDTTKMYSTTTIKTTTSKPKAVSAVLAAAASQQQCPAPRQKLTIFWHFNLMAVHMPSYFLMLSTVLAIMLTNHAVTAAQRETFKDKAAPFSINSNVNAIQSRHNNNNNVNNINIEHSNASQTNPSISSMNSEQRKELTTRSSRNLDGLLGGAAGISTTTTKNNEQQYTATTNTLQKATPPLNANGNGLSTVSTPLTKYGTVAPSQASASFKKFSVNSITTGGQRNSIELMDESRNGPYFDKSVSKNVTALLGKTAYLNCRVKNLGNKTMLLQVSWVRHRDIHLLTVGRYTYTSDQRFRALHQPQTEDWILQIKYPQHRDSGIYECQVSTTPHMSHYIHLNVVEPSTEIVGAPDLYIENGSTINLTCVIFNSPEPPAYIYWNHNDAIINYDSPRGGVSVVTNKGDTTTSFLLIKSARPSDSGQYQCNPSNSKPKMVTVHVLNGEFPAAMQRAGQAYHHMSRNHYLLVYLLIYLFTLVYVEHYIQPPVVVGATVMSMPFLGTGN